MNLARACVLLLELIHISSHANSAEVSGNTLPGSLTRFDRDYVLSGCGLRELLFSDIYLLGLYLPSPETDPVAIAKTGRVFLLKVLYKGDLPDDLPELWREPLASQLSKEYLDILQDIYDKVDNGDTVEFSFQPGMREELRINGKLEIRENQPELIPALTELWLGEDPVSGNLKRLLLKGSCE